MLVRNTTRSNASRPDSDSADDVLTPPEAAALLKISERTLWNLTKSGKVPARRVGVQWRYSLRLLLAHIEGDASPSA